MYEELLIVYEEYIGGGVVTTVMSEMASQLLGEFCKLAESCKTEKLLFAIALSGNSTKLELHHMGSLGLLFLWTNILLKNT